MEHYMSVDGGGTKIIALLYNDNLKLLGKGSGGGVNPRFEKRENIENNIEMCIRDCFNGLKAVYINRLYVSMVGSADALRRKLSAYAKVQEVIALNEGEISLPGAIQSRKGVIALSGTGSVVFALDGDACDCSGGWGSLIGDEGSGFYIGRKGIAAVVKEYEGCGPETLITKLIYDKYKVRFLREIIPIVYNSASPQATIASICPLVTKAAASGDNIAINIMNDAGIQMGMQVEALVKKNEAIKENGVTIAGGAWKGSRLMFESFCGYLTSEIPDIKIKMPLFEPVVGGVVIERLRTQDFIDSKQICRMMEEYSDYTYKTQWEEKANEIGKKVF